MRHIRGNVSKELEVIVIVDYFDANYISGGVQSSSVRGSSPGLEHSSPLSPDNWNMFQATVTNKARINVCGSWNHGFKHLLGHTNPMVGSRLYPGQCHLWDGGLQGQRGSQTKGWGGEHRPTIDFQRRRRWRSTIVCNLLGLQGANCARRLSSCSYSQRVVYGRNAFHVIIAQQFCVSVPLANTMHLQHMPYSRWKTNSTTKSS